MKELTFIAVALAFVLLASRCGDGPEMAVEAEVHDATAIVCNPAVPPPPPLDRRTMRIA